MNKYLIVVDMQNDFINGSLGTPEARAIIPTVKQKIQEYNTAGHEVIYTRDSHSDNYMNTMEGKNLPVLHCVLNTYGWNIPEDIDNNSCIHINKSIFGYPHWRLWLIDPEEIELIGLCTDICVISNALILKASFPETKITVDASCCAGVTPERHKAALEVMKSCQIEVIGE